MNIQIIDIGNTHTKFADFEVSEKGMVDLKDFHQVETPREDPQDLFELVDETIDGSQDALMINSFSGAFIYNHKWYFADKDVPPFEVPSVYALNDSHELIYNNTGQNNRFGLVGFPALLQSVKERAASSPETPHGWLIRNLFGIPEHWDITHASRSGVYHLLQRRWCELPETLNEIRAARQLLRTPVLQCGQLIHTTLAGMNVLVGGLDHSFISSYLANAYVASGTWCNIVQAEPCFLPDSAAAKAGIRWGILADGRYAKELVFPVNSVDANTFRAIKEALPMMNFTASMPLMGGSLDKVRVILEEKVRLFYDLIGGFPHLELKAAAYYVWRCLV